MKVKKGSIVEFHYTGCFDSGEEFSSTVGKKPIKCKVGEGEMIRGIEEALMGMQKLERKTIVVYPDKAYGERNETLVYKMPKDVIGDRSVEVGHILKVKNEKGKTFDARVITIEPDVITLDLNHLLAGRVLKFDIELIGLE